MIESLPSDEKLISSLQAREEDAFRHLVERFTPPLYSMVMRVLNNAQDAEDVLQETFISCWRGIHAFDGRAKLSSWIHRVAMNAALNRLRADTKRHRDVSLDGALEAVAAEQPTLDSLNPVWQAVAALPEEVGELIRLRYIEELNSEEIAAQLGLSSEGVRQKLHRARIVLATKLQPILCPTGDVRCGGDLRLLMDFIDQTLPEELYEPVRSHIENCPGCTASEVGFRWLARFMGSDLGVAIPAGLTHRLSLRHP